MSDARARDRRINEMLLAVGLDASFKRRHELLGGQLRRVPPARILTLEPRIVIFEEPTSGLDLSVQTTVLNLLRDPKDWMRLSYIFISHDLSVVEQMCYRVAIMYLGRIVEFAPTASIFSAPRHPYTRALVTAAPRLEPGGAMGGGIEGEPPSPRRLPSGVAFRTRCPHARVTCAETVPELEPTGPDHLTACIRWREIAERPPLPEARVKRDACS